MTRTGGDVTDVIEAHALEGEARAAVAAALRALAAGAAPERVAIVVPDLDEERLEPLRAALGDARLPFVEPRGRPATVSPEGRVACEFLGWLAEDNFVLLGHRRFAIAGGGLTVVEAENFGLLRDPAVPVFDALRDLSSIPPAVRAALTDPVPLTVAKANMRATVHRPQHADVVATRILDASGRVVGARLFLGLFAASAYNRNPRSIPLLRDAKRIAAEHPDAKVVLLGSIASNKYVSHLGAVFGERLLFPKDFVGRGDMSRGGLLLRAARAAEELSYQPVLGAVRHGKRPPKLEPVPGILRDAR